MEPGGSGARERHRRSLGQGAREAVREGGGLASDEVEQRGWGRWSGGHARMVGERARPAAGELVAVRCMGVLGGQGGGAGRSACCGRASEGWRGAWIDRQLGGGVDQEVGPALAGVPALAGLRSGFSRLRLFRENMCELFVDLGGN
jgi:hypothetical protein